jgi:hypothetical protein
MIPARGRRGLSSPRPGLLGLGASGAAVPGCRSSAGTRRPSPATNGAWGCGEMSCAGRASLFWPKQFGGASRMHRCIPAPTTPPPPRPTTPESARQRERCFLWKGVSCFQSRCCHCGLEAEGRALGRARTSLVRRAPVPFLLVLRRVRCGMAASSVLRAELAVAHLSRKDAVPLGTGLKKLQGSRGGAVLLVGGGKAAGAGFLLSPGYACPVCCAIYVYMRYPRRRPPWSWRRWRGTSLGRRRRSAGRSPSPQT